jgi:dienelactone hydrolase
MKLRLVIALYAGLCVAQVPEKDARWEAKEGTRFEFPMPHFESKSEWLTRREHLRKQILTAAGLFPMPKRSPIRYQVFDKLERDGYTIEKAYVETLPGYYLCGNLYRPRGKAGKFPGVLSPHGHWKNGRLEDQPLASVPGRAINLARQGYVVFAYDMVGYNDTKQTPHAFGEDREHLYNFSPLSLQLWNSIRAADFLEALPDVDRKRLAATGASGGGTQTFLLAAVDERIRVDVPVNMISGIMQGGSPCENAPGLRHDTTNIEIGAMMAPRPMLLVAATGDWTKNVPRNEYPAIKSIYALYDAASQVEAVQFDSPHNYHQDSREAMYTFFSKRLLGRDTGPVKEQPYTVEKREDMLVWGNRELPAGARDYEGVFREWQRMVQSRTPSKEKMRYVLSVENPQNVSDAFKDDHVYLTRPGHSDRVHGFYQPGKGSAVLIIHPKGAGDGRKDAPADRPVLAIDAWNTGDSQGSRSTSTNHFYTFHRTDSQNRVQDILTALTWLRSKHPGPIEIRATGDAIVWATFAAAVADRPVVLRTPATTFQGTDEEFVKNFFVPGVQRAGGWKAALALSRK